MPVSNETVEGRSTTTEQSFDRSTGMRLHDDDYWPPPRDRMHRCTIRLLSVHNLPKRGESRPRFDGMRSACHQYASQLSGVAAPPNNSDPSCPVIMVSLYCIGGDSAALTKFAALHLPFAVTLSNVSVAHSYL